MNHPYEHILSIAILMTLLLQGCAAAPAPLPGQIESIQMGSTVRGVQLAMQGAEGTAIYVRNSWAVYTWPFQNGWGFFLASTDPMRPASYAVIDGRGNYVAWQTMREFTTFLEQHGWRPIAAPVGLSLRKALEVGAMGEGLLLVFPVVPEMIPERNLQ